MTPLQLSPSQRGRILLLLFRRGKPLPLKAGPEAIAKAIVSCMGGQMPEDAAGQTQLMINFLYGKLEWEPLPAIVPLKPQRGMDIALARCAEYRKAPSWFDKARNDS